MMTARPTATGTSRAVRRRDAFPEVDGTAGTGARRTAIGSGVRRQPPAAAPAGCRMAEVSEAGRHRRRRAPAGPIAIGVAGRSDGADPRSRDRPGRRRRCRGRRPGDGRRRLGGDAGSAADGAAVRGPPGVAGVAASSTATLPDSRLSQLTWTGDGDAAGSTDSTTPFGGSGANGSAQSRPMAAQVERPGAVGGPDALGRAEAAVGRRSVLPGAVLGRAPGDGGRAGEDLGLVGADVGAAGCRLLEAQRQPVERGAVGQRRRRCRRRRPCRPGRRRRRRRWRRPARWAAWGRAGTSGPERVARRLALGGALEAVPPPVLRTPHRGSPAARAGERASWPAPTARQP